jgi:hypothetical protein
VCVHEQQRQSPAQPREHQSPGLPPLRRHLHPAHPLPTVTKSRQKNLRRPISPVSLKIEQIYGAEPLGAGKTTSETSRDARSNAGASGGRLLKATPPLPYAMPLRCHRSGLASTFIATLVMTAQLFTGTYQRVDNAVTPFSRAKIRRCVTS